MLLVFKLGVMLLELAMIGCDTMKESKAQLDTKKISEKIFWIWNFIQLKKSLNIALFINNP